MPRFTLSNTMNDIFTAPVFQKYSQYLMYNNPNADVPLGPPGSDELPLSAMAEIGWSPEGVIAGLECFADAIEQGRVNQHFVYTEKERTAPQMEHVNFIQILPETYDKTKPTVVLCAGGAYFGVCTMVESLPTVRHFLAQGYQVFIFTYRVCEDAITPKAISDLARGIQYLCENKDTLCVDPNRIVVGGYSAGANLISNWGVPGIGYKAYNLPKPLALLPVYTFIDLKAESERDENGGLLAPMFGPNFREEFMKYNIADMVDSDYPPCYITCGKNDTTVPPRNSELLKELLDKAGVPSILDEGENAPHGFGDGTGTDVEGWPERAIEFIESL